MFNRIIGKSALVAAVLTVLAAGTPAQVSEPTPRKNFGYSQNPRTRAERKTEPTVQRPETVQDEILPVTSPTSDPQPEPTRETAPTIAQKTLDVVRSASRKAIAPTENYLVGVGDVLFIAIKNTPRASTYFTVLNDGTIDYPLAGEMVQVLGMATDEIEELLAGKIKVLESPEVSVRVREYNSHRITVLGLVEKSGERPIQREAVPLFVVRAEALVRPDAERVSVKRADGKIETFDLKEPSYENVLVFPNDIVEFTGPDIRSASNRFVFVGGDVVSGGQKEWHDGLTLTQAVLVSGGPRKERSRKAVIRRKNAEGLLVASTHDLRAIRDGKAPDPKLEAGDLVEIEK